MNLKLDVSVATGYKSKSQIARVITEGWVAQNAYCPACGAEYVQKFENNRPAADFFCTSCREQYELKSAKSVKSKKIPDGAYKTMVERINSFSNPSLFLLSYDRYDLTVKDFVLIPKFYFTEGLIEKRKSLSSSAQRAGWQGCSILLGEVPRQGRLYIVRDSQIVPIREVNEKWRTSAFLANYQGESRSWFLDIMRCIDLMHKDEFKLEDMYGFEGYLKARHQSNNFIREKIRQQLQVLRDKGIIEFASRGIYRLRRV